GGGRKGGPLLALVGKGITFDSGGISIKPALHMEMMKSDMGGGAAVVGAMLAIAQLKPKINVIGIVPTTENMPSGKASKPWDGATTAALFLREFVESRPWVHLDIAGSAWQDAAELKTVPKGPTGSGVRVMAHLAQLLADH